MAPGVMGLRISTAAGSVRNRPPKTDQASRPRMAKTIRIESDVDVPYQMDGDPGGVLPVEIEVLPQRVTLVAPAPGVDDTLAGP